MSSTSAYMPWYIGDYLRDTSHLVAHEHGAYLLMIAHAWQHDGALPLDHERIRKIARLTSEQWAESQSVLLDFWTQNGTAYRQKRLDQELPRAVAKYQQRLEAARRGGLKSASVRSTDRSTERSSVRLSEDTSVRSTNQNQEKKKTKTRSLRSLPLDWQPSESTTQTLAAEFNLRIPDDIDRYVVAFRDACQARGYRYKDFDAAFRNCVRADWPKLRGPNGELRASSTRDPTRPISIV